MLMCYIGGCPKGDDAGIPQQPKQLLCNDVWTTDSSRPTAATTGGGGGFLFFHELISECYCPDNGRPSWDPLMLFKMVFLQFLFDTVRPPCSRSGESAFSCEWFDVCNRKRPLPAITLCVCFFSSWLGRKLPDYFQSQCRLGAYVEAGTWSVADHWCHPPGNKVDPFWLPPTRVMTVAPITATLQPTVNAAEFHSSASKLHSTSSAVLTATINASDYRSSTSSPSKRSITGWGRHNTGDWRSDVAGVGGLHRGELQANRAVAGGAKEPFWR